MNIPSNDNFNDSYKALTGALERIGIDLDSSEPSSSIKIARLILEINDLAATDTEKIQLRMLAERVAKISLDDRELKKAGKVVIDKMSFLLEDGGYEDVLCVLERASFSNTRMPEEESRTERSK